MLAGPLTMSDVSQIKFVGYDKSIAKALDLIGAGERLPQDGLIIIKPNLTNADKTPVTTHVGAGEAVYEYCREHSRAEIAIGEGCGSGVTRDTFEANGYADLARRQSIRLIDFNEEPAEICRRPDALVWKELHMPIVVRDAFVISLPVLKDHSFTTTTVAMKNLFGLIPAPHYRGSWNKSRLHTPSTHKSVFNVCLHKRPDLCVVDASVALTGMHLAGTPRSCLTFSSLNAPIQQVPRPSPTAARVRWSRAMAKSISTLLPQPPMCLYACSGNPQPTTITGACAIQCCPLAAAATSRRSFASWTRMKCHGWMLQADGA
jgi:uncharacterized protein (DUF362 family)